jgi:hypothetical protein
MKMTADLPSVAELMVDGLSRDEAEDVLVDLYESSLDDTPRVYCQDCGRELDPWETGCDCLDEVLAY